MAGGSLSIVTSLMMWQYFYHYFEYLVTTRVEAKVEATRFAHEQLSEISKLCVDVSSCLAANLLFAN